MAATSIPFFYRSAFVIFDIALPVFGVWAYTTAPRFILRTFSISPAFPPATETIVLLDALAGWHAVLIALSLGFLITKRDDIVVWQVLQLAILVLDIFMLGAFARQLSTEGRTDFELWNNNDWSNVTGTAVIAFVRFAFLCGIGIGRHEKSKVS
ncbi:protein of unknown function [Taphrina deformans PYCC 5710]|uniref:DUF7704 domain-containing protein n=1 Tax=Taphrina deformans (strain PYCC 5710 / ATCC 11124 / CBS 356.35 / IMI 108563 / JCM 9778 / NBRC 8474) TaxID=1097556 RepID=R4XGZ7_TAPDE|nr:protein of unknown function [Taphrina deformans PYCC 5710]|eukprot:CCG84963.1 protein of unknown function [Taphrina deformans PYCC 5710]